MESSTISSKQSFQEMNKLISKVSPLTKAIIWLAQKPIEPQSESYRAIDYLLNGLLTSSINANPELSSRVLIAEQFGETLHVFIAHKAASSEFTHFTKLIEDNITSENNILLIDEISSFEEMSKNLSAKLKNNIVKYH